ncbi:spore coat polysaccharide biosynthesis protein F, CMP-KDO synthetase [Halobacteroides halobius DSM 5150]|uniref:Spore coat polysaccharide biosynthesis protein F, CMP-KDO synthetase n=1 Tax=Halobacteroides halobius (strain ATCC 35273 / DSM 5150 / MD-1) TaxID=748449 RepID=L0K9X4_HALHC|nr:glycosyltransferase family protein [Halobacteroides halobius]AGB42117.1 spore coat polysaccharide biosynthesis protein F, CMP-KDO synthetase [Halobacteroides halobius DSM 5150]
MNRNKKVVAIVQARMGSSRLPGKVAKEIVGRPMLAHLIERLKYFDRLDQIVIATSDKEIDDRVVEIAKNSKVDFYRGSEDDVLSRYIEAAQKFKADVIVRITGDCPLIDPMTIDKAVTKFLNSDYDYFRLNVGDNGYPRGLDTEIFSSDTLLKVEEFVLKEEENKDNPYREHVTFYINRHPDKFKITSHNPKEDLKRNYRLCVDEIDDFKLIKELYQRLYQIGEIINIQDVIRLLDDNSELAQINRKVQQKKV